MTQFCPISGGGVSINARMAETVRPYWQDLQLSAAASILFWVHAKWLYTGAMGRAPGTKPMNRAANTG
jgi:hypothetical protein